MINANNDWQGDGSAALTSIFLVSFISLAVTIITCSSIYVCIMLGHMTFLS